MKLAPRDWRGLHPAWAAGPRLLACRRMPQYLGPASRRRLPLCVVGAAFILCATRAHATPLDFLPVGDPLESELRALDVLGQQYRLPHLGTRPIEFLELAGLATVGVGGSAQRISVARLSRALIREGLSGLQLDPILGTTPRLLQLNYADEQRLDVSAGIEGQGNVDRDRSWFTSGSGFHVRAAAGFHSLVVFSHVMAAHVDQGRSFADPIFSSDPNLIIHSEESYLAYRGVGGRWGFQFGRSRWQLGPGEEASLLLSGTAAPLTGLALRARIDPLRADGIALSVTLDPASGEQLAMHRLEWQPSDGLRLGIGEGARYRSDAWRPLYLMGMIPYVLVQRLEVQDRPDSAAALRNNVLVAFDGAWRVVPGLRAYGEGLVDDIHSANGSTRKYGYQLGAEGVTALGDGRLVWGTEYTRLTRYVYTSFFGRSFAAQGRPLGFPTGPDARRIRVRAAWDPSPNWQVLAVVGRVDKGENDLDEPFVPGVSSPRSESFEGVVEHQTDVEASLRFWPESGIELSVSGGYAWARNLGHVPGASNQGATAALGLRWTR